MSCITENTKIVQPANFPSGCRTFHVDLPTVWPNPTKSTSTAKLYYAINQAIRARRVMLGSINALQLSLHSKVLTSYSSSGIHHPLVPTCLSHNATAFSAECRSFTMNSSRVPESPEPPKMAASSPEKGGATSCTTENPKPRESIAEAEPVSVNDVPKGPGLDHDESKSPILEAFVSQTTVPGGTDGTSKKPSPDDEHTQPTLWCRVELHDPQQWAKCVIVDNPIEKQFLHTTEAPEKNTRTNLWQYTALLKHIAKRPPVRNAPPIPHTPPVPRASTTNSSPIGYSNRFLDRNGQFLFTQSWPEALDFDLERGKAAGLMAQSHKPIIELITTVKTNIDTANKVYSDTPAILSNPSVTADYSLREVVIHSICIIEAFKATILYYPGLDLQGMELTISEPYSAFWHYHQELKAIQTTGCTFLEPPVGDKQPETTPTGSQSPNADTIQHLKLLCDLIESQNLEEVKLEQERHRQDPPVATYQMMWLLFKPGTRVYYFSDGRATAGVVVSIQTDNDPQRLGPRSLKLWSLDFDGFKLGRRALRYKFKPFDGEKRVSELHVCPCDIYDAYDNSCLRSELISRGRKFWNFLPGIQVDYEGKLPNEAMEWVSLPNPPPFSFFSKFHCILLKVHFLVPCDSHFPFRSIAI